MVSARAKAGGVCCVIATIIFGSLIGTSLHKLLDQLCAQQARGSSHHNLSASHSTIRHGVSSHALLDRLRGTGCLKDWHP